MRRRILCAFDSPDAARVVVPQALDLAASEVAELTFLGVLRPERLQPGGLAAPRTVRRRAYLELALARAAERAAQAGATARIHLVAGDDPEREAVSQALAQGAHRVLLAEDGGVFRRTRMLRLSLRPARVASLWQAGRSADG